MIDHDTAMIFDAKITMIDHGKINPLARWVVGIMIGYEKAMVLDCKLQ